MGSVLYKNQYISFYSMKNLFTLLICTLCLSLQAQYAPLLYPGHIWQIERTFGDPADIPPPDKWHQQLIISGDTVLGGDTYQLIWGRTFYQEYFQAGMVVSDSSVLDPYLYAMMREDSSTQQVYIWRTNDSTGGADLWFDFSLDVGDTLFSDFYSSNLASPIVTDIDSLMLANGEMRRVFTVTMEGIESRFIEGVGSEEGFREPITLPTVSGAFWSESILCQRKDSVEIYGTCSDFLASVSSVSPSPLSIYPNPASEYITVSTPAKMEQISIRDLQGRIIQRWKPRNSSDSQEVNLSFLPAGIYLLQVKVRNHAPVQRLIQKQ